MATARVVASLLTGLLVLTGFVAAGPGAAPAAAATGSISDFELRVFDDGTSVAPGDKEPNDGLVGLGNLVNFGWTMTLTGLQDGVITQLLPEGWAWDRSSLDLSGLHNPEGKNGYVSTYSLSQSSRLLTVKIASDRADAGVQLVDLTNISGGPKRISDAVGVEYFPTVSVSDGDSTREIGTTGTPKTVTSVGVHQVDLRNRLSSSGGGSPTVGQDVDFGQRAEPAIANKFTVSVRNEAVTVAGTRPVVWSNDSVRISGQYSLTGDGIDQATLPHAVEISGAPTYGVTARLENINTAAGTFELVLEGEKLNDDQFFAGSGSAEISIYIPTRLVPSATEKPINVSVSVAPSVEQPWLTVDGQPLSDTGKSETTAQGWYRQKDNTPRPPTLFEPKVSGAVKRVDENNAIRFNRIVFPGYGFIHRVDFQPYGFKEHNATTSEVPPTEELNFFEFWDAAEYSLVAPGKLKPELGEVLQPGADYRVFVTDEAGPQYATEPDTANALTLNWAPLESYDGDRSQINGLRYEFVEAYVPNNGEPVEKIGQAKISAETQLKVARGYVNGMPDTGVIYTHGLVSAKTQHEEYLEYTGDTTESLTVRAGTASPSISGVGLDSSHKPVGSKDPIIAGQAVRYTALPTLGKVDGSPEADSELAKQTKITGLQLEMLLPENLVLSTIDFSRIDTHAWRWEFGEIDDKGRMPLTFFYKLPLHSLQTVASPVVIDVSTSQIAPQSDDGYFYLEAAVRADQIYNADGSATWIPAGIKATQAPATKVEIEAVTPELDPGEAVEYEIDWFNFLTQVQGESSFMTVLPYNGDERGTSVTGPITLAEAALSASDRVGAKLQLTTDAGVRQIPRPAAPAAEYRWIDYEQATPEQIAGATALRVVVADFVSGAESIGRLAFTLNAPKSCSGDGFAGTVSGSLKGASTVLPEAAPALARVTSAEVSGIVWNDANGDGLRDETEHTLSGVTIVLTRGDQVVDRMQTDAHGEYRFSELASGAIVVSVDAASLPPTTGKWQNTVSPSNGSDGVSGLIELGRGGVADAKDFGFQNLEPRVELTKQGIAPKVPLPGQPILWQFTVRNTGNTSLSDVKISDELEGVSEIRFDSWPDEPSPGELAPGQEVTATATSALTQQQLDQGTAANSAAVSAASSATPNPVTAEAAATVPLAGVATLAIEKSAMFAEGVDPEQAAAGDTVKYAFTVTNTGTLTLSDVTIDDPLAGMSDIAFEAWPDATAPGRLAPGDSANATASLELTQAHIDESVLKNEAVASANTPSGQSIHDDDDAFVVFDATPVIDLDKSVTAHDGGAVGSLAEYRFVITNPGNSTLSDVRLIDSLPGLSNLDIAWPGQEGELAPGEQAVATASITLTQQHLDEGVLVNSASATAKNPVTGVTTKDTDEAEVIFTQLPDVQLEKQGTLSVAEGTIDYSVTATNTGNVTLDGVTMTDELDGLPRLDIAWPGEAGTLSPGQKAVGTATLALSQQHIDDGTITNTATVSAQRVGASAGEEPVTAAAKTATVVPGTAAISLRVAPEVLDRNVTVDAVADDTVLYTYTVTNQGTLTLRDITLSDELEGLADMTFGEWPAAEGELAPGEQVTATAKLSLTQQHIDEGFLVNEGVVSGLSLSGLARATHHAGSELVFTTQPAISLAKTVDAGDAHGVGDEATYEFTVTNAGGVTLHDVSVTDELDGLSALRFGDWPGEPGTLKPGEAVIAHAALKIEQAHIDAGGVLNTATATGTAKGITSTATASAELLTQQAPGLSLTKRAALSLKGDRVNYTLTATNTGNVSLSDVTFTDEMPGLTALDIDWPGTPGVLKPGDRVTAKAHLEIVDAHRGTTLVNHALVTGSMLGNHANTVAQASAEQRIPNAPGIINAIGTLVVTGAYGFSGVLFGATLLLAAGLLAFFKRRGNTYKRERH
ncbi:DUF11 domain-containing protein [Leucobacter sp. UCMA 4100]|uniref:DUF7507 domain-containing protein n=1 Tax=Leucobacter sp. UCMA 4100 TaxID=2810534 RepID=UPI0022EA6372|nr:SdrD B-like domain-containing protein [Leucobacter sp. UCMA 4100]MDA3148029.1 DUF11 domain-containing protein [Leucobacter sp. UCMA 4100]